MTSTDLDAFIAAAVEQRDAEIAKRDDELEQGRVEEMARWHRDVLAPVLTPEQQAMLGATVAWDDEEGPHLRFTVDGEEWNIVRTEHYTILSIPVSGVRHAWAGWQSIWNDLLLAIHDRRVERDPVVPTLDAFIAAAVERRAALIAEQEVAEQQRREAAIEAFRRRIDSALPAEVQRVLNLHIDLSADRKTPRATCIVDGEQWCMMHVASDGATSLPSLAHWIVYATNDMSRKSYDEEVVDTLMLAIHDWRVKRDARNARRTGGDS